MKRLKPTHHGGPIEYIGTLARSKRKRGYKPTSAYKSGSVRVIVSNGQILQPAKFKNILSPKPIGESLVMPITPLGRVGIPAPTQTPARADETWPPWSQTPEDERAAPLQP